MRQIGVVKRLQVQRGRLKLGTKPFRYYEPAPIQTVEQLVLATEGAVGVTAAGERILDIHNALHPESRNRDGMNGVSLGFTSHYRLMRERFGEHLWDGCAGESILVETREEIGPEMLEGKRVMIRDQESEIPFSLERLVVATPCVEFTRFALNESMYTPAEILREALIFLDHGRRGFYATFAGEQPRAVRAGAGVFVEDEQ